MIETAHVSGVLVESGGILVDWSNKLIFIINQRYIYILNISTYQIYIYIYMFYLYIFTMKKDSSDSLEFLKFLDQLSSLDFNNLVPHASRVLNFLSSSRWLPMTSGEDDLVDYTDIFSTGFETTTCVRYRSI